jgi:peptidyl-prolyl cis-trans isomerase A (cyclophilin A)
VEDKTVIKFFVFLWHLSVLFLCLVCPLSAQDVNSGTLQPLTSTVNAPVEVIFVTSLGSIQVSLEPALSPLTVANFLEYVDSGFYNGTIFHRVILGFVVQGGGHDVQLVERESGLFTRNAAIHNEADNGLKNVRGTIAMARMDEIDSATNQFYFNVADNANLDHSEESCTREDELQEFKARERGLSKPRTCKTFGYAVFGHVTEGMEVLEEIEFVETGSKDGFDDLPVNPVIIHSVRRK